MPLSPWVRSKMTSGGYVTHFSLPEENDWLLLGVDCPHRGVSCRSLFSYCGGDHERAGFDRIQNP